jgi:hypothetical protein
MLKRVKMKINEKETIWAEKYRPQTIDDLVFPQSEKEKIKSWIKTSEVPNIGLFGTIPGTGKTSFINAVKNDLNTETLWLNGSKENSVDTFRYKVSNFASKTSMKGKIRLVIIDECLEENEKVRIGTVDNWKAVKLNELEKGKKYPIVSFNMETEQLENDTGEVITDKYDDIYEIELEDGRKIQVTSNHPFLVRDKNGKIVEKTSDDGLKEGDTIISI